MIHHLDTGSRTLREHDMHRKSGEQPRREQCCTAHMELLVAGILLACQPSHPAASCFSWAVMALRMNIATVTGPTPPGTGVTQLAISFTSSVSTSPTIVVSPFGPVI